MSRAASAPADEAPGAGAANDDEDTSDRQLRRTLHRSVEAGEERLDRPTANLIATGVVGGLDIGVGVMALVVVSRQTGSHVLGSLAFGIGFIALTLARSELFTENFLLPVSAVVARRTGFGRLLRLWVGTLAANWAAGWVFMYLLVVGLPDVEPTVIELGRHYPEMGIGAEAFASALLGGAVITLVTWLERATTDIEARLVAAVSGGFLLALGPLNHSVVGALEMFGALIVGAPFGYLDALGAASFAVVGNLVGGVGLVTVVRLIQVGADAVEQESAGRRG
ncbi:MAG: formate/nitrite transporter family protein [Actinomycetota bacterium]|nr:formate/nitrite transporter family protein [Actinomycetota bacterium]